MRLKSFLTEKPNELDFFDPDILSRITEIKSKLLKIGFKSVPYKNDDNFPFRDDNNEIVQCFTDGIFEITIFVIKSDLNTSVNPNGQIGHFDAIIDMHLVGKFSFDGEDAKVIFTNPGNAGKTRIVELLDDFNDDLHKLEEFTDWFFDVTAIHKGIKFKINRSFLSNNNRPTQLPQSVQAIGGEYSFHTSNEKGKIFK